MPQNRHFRNTRLPESLNGPPHEGKWSAIPISDTVESSDSRSTPLKPNHTVTSFANHHAPLNEVKKHVSYHDKSTPLKAVKLLVERTEAEGTDVLMIGDQRYDKIQLINQAGPGILSLEDSDFFPLVVIREFRSIPKKYPSIQPASHANIINLRAAFYHKESITTVYDYEIGAMALSSVSNCPSVRFSEADIATVCRDVLQGLDFVHSEIKIAHGMVNDRNILLTLTGGIKIGDSMLKKITLKDRDCDLKAVGTIAMNLADHTTKIERPEVTHWKAPVSQNLRGFISRTSEVVLGMLLKHEFLVLAAPSWSLKPHLTKSMKFDPSFRQIASVT